MDFMKTHMILGGLGQDGILLSNQLIREGEKVVSYVKQETFNLSNQKNEKVIYIFDDIFDQSKFLQNLSHYRPDYIYNFVSLSSVSESYANPMTSRQINYIFVKQLLELLLQYQEKSQKVITVFQASSSEMFGNFTNGKIVETTPLNPLSPYAEHKAMAHELIKNYNSSDDFKVFIGILFNHESYLRKPKFVSRKITQGAYQISIGKLDFLHLGNIDSSRDWGYAPDYVEAIKQIVRSNQPGDYVIASGELHTLREICEVVFQELVLGNYEKFLIIDEKLKRINDTVGLVGDSSKINMSIGWKPKKKFVEIFSEMARLEKSNLN
jgi:GDPmannose 4,6-dehydratase